MSAITIRTDIRPGDLGYITYLVGLLYAKEYGMNLLNDIEMANFITHFVPHHRPEKERLWIAETDEHIVGSVIVFEEHPGVAHLRSLLLHPSVRGRGLGRRLVQLAIDFCREVGYQKITLETFDELHAALHLYNTFGFQQTGERFHAEWGRPVREVQFELVLSNTSEA
ncbi:GNAT family N-acetyltransferase [Runella sp.]|uniref:GNAT family N-acetyltransferase n=1 Tax=Runella sp. TaxID=1960881 RepID=UPI003D0B9226